MARNNDAASTGRGEPRGFAGLDKLTSDLDDIFAGRSAPPEAAPAGGAAFQRPDAMRARSRTDSRPGAPAVSLPTNVPITLDPTGERPISVMTWLLWILAAVAVITGLWFMLQTNQASRTPAREAQEPAASTTEQPTQPEATSQAEESEDIEAADAATSTDRADADTTTPAPARAEADTPANTRQPADADKGRDAGVAERKPGKEGDRLAAGGATSEHCAAQERLIDEALAALGTPGGPSAQELNTLLERYGNQCTRQAQQMASAQERTQSADPGAATDRQAAQPATRSAPSKAGETRSAEASAAAAKPPATSTPPGEQAASKPSEAPTAARPAPTPEHRTPAATASTEAPRAETTKPASGEPASTRTAPEAAAVAPAASASTAAAETQPAASPPPARPAPAPTSASSERDTGKPSEPAPTPAAQAEASAAASAAEQSAQAPDPQQTQRELVTAIQRRLNELGYEAGSEDGIAGAGTRAAIRLFQSVNGLAGTGVADQALLSALEGSPRPAPPQPVAQPTPPARGSTPARGGTAASRPASGPATAAPVDTTAILQGASAFERLSIERVCAAASAGNSAAQERCLSEQAQKLAQSPGRPDLAKASTTQRIAIENACNFEKRSRGPSDYYSCLQRELERQGL